MWMRDVKFFSAELLLCLCSTQLYASTTPSTQWPGLNSPSDLVLNFLYSRGEAQLREALGGGQTNSSAFSSCLAVQLVRAGGDGLCCGRLGPVGGSCSPGSATKGTGCGIL